MINMDQALELPTRIGDISPLDDGEIIMPRQPKAAENLHGEIVGRLRDYIVEGNLADGSRIPERLLCEKFGISRTPLREALKVMASEGLIDLLPNRGARIRSLGAEEIQQLFDVMGGLEALAGRLACEVISEAEINQVVDLHQEMYGYYLRRDLHEYFRCNQLIHEKIVEFARNPVLSATYSSFAGRIRRVRYSANLASKQDRWGEAMREHEAILDALRRRDGAELSDIMFKHLRKKQMAASGQLADGEILPDSFSDAA